MAGTGTAIALETPLPTIHPTVMRKSAPLLFTLALAGSAISYAADTAPADNAPKTSTSAATAWPQDLSDIPADPRAIFGRLPNGFRYIILPNKEPQKRVSLRIHIASGSIEEADDQQGLAHFLEHMVFNGSKHFKADELVPKMQRLGIGFGAHVNAETSFDETIYMLDLPDLSEDTVSMGFNVLRDFGDGANLDQSEIDKERGVILSEKTSSDSIEERLMVQQFAEILPGSIIGKRFPIGQENVIKAAQRERFTDFYSRYYTPDRMTFVVVGDIDPKAMEQRIKDTFSSMVKPETPSANPDLGKIERLESVKPSVFADKEVASTELSLVQVRPYVKTPDNKAHRLVHLPIDIANSIIGRRFERLAKQDNSPITSGSMSRDELFNHAELGSVDVTVTDDRWQEAVPVMEQEFRRALEHGFTAAELAEAKAKVINAYEQAVKVAPTRKSEALASAIAQSINQGSVISTPEADLEIVKQGLDALTLESCHQAFQKYWSTQGLHLILTTRESEADTKDKLLEIYNTSHAKPVEAPSQQENGAFAYTDFGPAGTVKSRKEIGDLGIVQLVFSNGVHVNLKKTDFEKNKIRLLNRIGDGKLSQPAQSPGLDMFSTAIFEGGGFGKHSVDDLQGILAGKNVGTKCQIEEDAFLQSGATTPDNLELQLQFMCAEISDPGYREEALTEFRNQLPALFQELNHSQEGAQAHAESWLHGDDARYAVPDQAKLMTYTIDDAKKWLTPLLSQGYLELSIIGDIDEATLLPLLLKTFGALPPRTETPPDDAAARRIDLPKAPASRAFTYDSKIPQGTALILWKTEGLRGNQKLFRRFNLVGEILSDMLREEIREKMGASYSPEALASGSAALADYGFILAECVGKPEDTVKLADTATRLGAKFATKGVKQDDLDRARKPILSEMEESLRDNTYWLDTVMAESQSLPESLELARTRAADYKSVTLDEINKLAKTYLGDKNALKVMMTNEQKQ
ncbi:MAG: peptidase domain protein [Akkermansiaceae bacterium]|nr:peptidase domain protein [Akkermansiaceae bacterium]